MTYISDVFKDGPEGWVAQVSKLVGDDEHILTSRWFDEEIDAHSWADQFVMELEA